jgi:hypothetical protein
MRSGSRIDAMVRTRPTRSRAARTSPPRWQKSDAGARQLQTAAETLPIDCREHDHVAVEEFEHELADVFEHGGDVCRQVLLTDAPNEKCPPAPSRMMAFSPRVVRASAKTRRSAAISGRSMMLPRETPNVTRQYAPSSTGNHLNQISHQPREKMRV